MTYSVTIHFTTGDRTYQILRSGWTLPQTVGAKGKHATQSLSLSILSAEAFALFATETQRNVKAEVKCDETTIFQGVVRPYLTTSASGSREDAVSMEILDYTELLHFYITADEVVENKNLDATIDYLFEKAGVSTTRSYPTEFSSDSVGYLALSEGEYVDDVLSTLLYERGYDYRFTATGCEFFATTTESEPTQTISDIRGTLSVQRDDDWNEGLSVTYPRAKEDDIVIYSHKKEGSQATIGGTAVSYPGGIKYIGASGLYYDGAQHSGETTPQDGKAKVTWAPQYNEKTDASIKLVGLQNVTIRAWMGDEEGVELTTHLEDVTLTGGRLWLNYSGNFDYHSIPIASWFTSECTWSWIWNIEVRAHVLYLVDDSVEIASESGQRPETSTESLSYIYTEAKAQSYVQRTIKRQKTSSFSYSFKSLTAYTAGSFYKLQDSITGINQTVRVLSCNQSADGTYSIKAESASTMAISDIAIKKLYYSDMENSGSTAFRISVSKDTLQDAIDVSTLTAQGVITASSLVTYKWTLGDTVLGTTNPLAVGIDKLSAGANTITCTAYYNGEEMASTTCTLTRVNAKGQDGKDGSSVEVQYSYSPSADTCYDEFIQWSDSDVYWGTEQALWNTWLANSPAEKEGYYIWMRARIGTADWQYTRLTGVQAKLFNLKCSQSTLTRNDRNETQGTVTFECDIQGYVDYTPSLTINGEEVALSISEGVYYYVYNYYYKNARSIEAKLFNGHELMDTVILVAVDETPPVAYIGVQDELPTKNGDLLLLEGDSCVYLGAVYIYQSVGGWKKTTESTLSQTARAQALTWAMNDVLKNIKDGSITATEYAYFENVVANIITASYIGSKTIELQEGGYIQSQGFNPDTSEKGFRLDYDGVLQTVRAIMKDVTINDGTLNAGALKTVNADTLGSWCATCGMPSENGKWSGVIKVVNEQGSSETVGTLNVARTCYYNVKDWAQWFLDNVPVNNTAFTKLTGTIDGYNVYAMRFSQETWAQVFAQTCSWEIVEKSKSWEWTVSWEQYYKDLKIVIKNISQLTLAKSLAVSVDGVVKSTSASEGTITISQLSNGTHTISITVDTNKLNSGTFSVVASTSITSVYAGRLYKNATSGISSDRILLMLYSGTDDSIVFEGGTASNTLRVCSINSDSYPNGKMTNALYWESSFGDYYHTLATSLEKGGNSLICGSGYDDWNIQHYTQFAPLYEVGAYDSSTGAVVWKSTPTVKKACSYKVSNVFINGILYDKDFTVTWTGSVFNLASDDGTVNITYSTSEYYTSLSYISYAEVAESKGAYVASLYPIEKDVSDIGSVNQKFDAAYINTVHSDTVYGAKFSSTTLCNTTSTGTITLPDALTNYEWITMYVSYGGSAGLTGNVATFHSSNWSNWQTNNGILLFGDISNSSSKTYTVQITSATQLTATTSSVGFTLTVIGYK